MDKEGRKQLLFVDDEQRVLDGIKRSLYSMRHEWGMEFVTSGKDALRYLQEYSVDMIISDMKMPVMDGAELLSIVKKLYPQTIRFILSGYSDREMILKTIGTTDQFINKPCDPVMLKEIITRALESFDVIDDNKIRAFVSKIESLPTMPELYKQLKEKLESSTSSFKEIADIISKDVSMTAKILQLVNSSLFGLRQKINNIHYATTYLGIDIIRAIILISGVFSQFTKEEAAKFSIKKLHKHSVAAGALSTEIIKTLSTDRGFTERAGMAGMLHDVGKLILIRNKPEQFEEIYQRSKSESVSRHELEKDYFGITHAEVGAYLLGIWNLPDDVVKAISYHHKPSLASLDTSYSMVLSVYVTNVLCHQQTVQQKKGNLYRIDKNYLSELNMVNKLPQWREIAKKFK